MDASVGAGRSRLNHYGPWALVGAALLVIVAVEGVRHHVFTRYSLLLFLIVVPTIVLHEVTHGFVAYLCGDDTAKRARRLSLNPIRHIDLFGTILVPLLLIVTTHSAFGWAKPVPVSVNRLRHPRNEAVLVGLAGPAVNLLIAIAAGLLFRWATNGGATVAGSPDAWPMGDEILFLLGLVNVFIAVFNLIPIPPLDGAAVIERLLPTSLLPGYYRLRPFSLIIVLFFVLFEPNALIWLFNEAERIWIDAIIV